MRNSQRPRSSRCIDGFGRSLLASALLVGCSPHSVEHDPAPPLALPESYGGEVPADGTATGERRGPRPERWWRYFADPELTRLVDLALRGNFDLQAAWARLSQAAAAVEIAGSGFWPQVNAEVGGSHVRRTGPQTRFTGATINSASASLSAAYEVDVFRRIGSAEDAAELDAAAAHDAVESLSMTLAAEVAEAWYDLVVVRARRAIVQSQLESTQTVAGLIETRFGQGQATAVELNQQRQLVYGNRAALEQIAASEGVLKHRLAALLGEVPSGVRFGDVAELPALPPLPATGVPSDLLKRRPDLRAAQRNVEAADHRVAAAVADRYPRLSLSASVSSQPSDFNDMLLDPLWTLAANLAMPLIDGGRRAAEVERTRAVVAEAVANYGQVVLGALIEVENALVQERQQRANIAHLREQLEVSEVTLEQARQRYGYGLADFLTVLTALRSHQEVELQLLDARRQLLSFRIQLCRALGGTWTRSLAAPSASSTSGESSTSGARSASGAATGAGGVEDRRDIPSPAPADEKGAP